MLFVVVGDVVIVDAVCYTPPLPNRVRTTIRKTGFVDSRIETTNVKKYKL